MSDAALHQRVPVLGVGRESSSRVLSAPASRCRSTRRSGWRRRRRSCRTIPGPSPPAPISTQASCPHTSSVAPCRPGRQVDLVGQHVAVEDALRVTAVGCDHDGDVRVRADPVVSRPRSAPRPPPARAAAARSHRAGRRSPRPRAWPGRRRRRSSAGDPSKITWYVDTSASPARARDGDRASCTASASGTTASLASHKIHAWSGRSGTGRRRGPAARPRRAGASRPPAGRRQRHAGHRDDGPVRAGDLVGAAASYRLPGKNMGALRSVASRRRTRRRWRGWRRQGPGAAPAEYV